MMRTNLASELLGALRSSAPTSGQAGGNIAELAAPTPRNEQSADPSAIAWLIAVVAVVIQEQGAFVSIPEIMRGDEMRGVVNPYNTAAVLASLVLISAVALRHGGRILALARRNILSVLFIVLVLSSASWSLHPDLTIRRGIGYLLTVFIAIYLTVGFRRDDRFRVMSYSFAVAAVGSFLFVVVAPQFGIMAGPLAGAWRGVFPHKNVLGPVMAIAVFTELYLLCGTTGSSRWRWILLALYLLLVFLSRSTTARILSGFYLGMAGLYLLWRKRRAAAALAWSTLAICFVGAVLLSWNNPGGALSALGKDQTISGRSVLWRVVIERIGERPALGWGYRASWEPEDPVTVLADKLTGNYGVVNSENAFLEITVQLGVVGLLLLSLICGEASWRAIRCCQLGLSSLGWFALSFLIGSIAAAQTTINLAQNQGIDWVMFCVLSFSCGSETRALADYYVAATLYE